MQKEKANNKSVCCYGSEIPYDHPKVYLEIDPKLKFVACPYCSKRFELKI